MFLSEKGEVDAAVSTVLDKAGMIGEVVMLAMLKDEEPVGLQQVFLQDQIGDLRQLIEGVGGIGEDDVELLMATLQETEYVATDENIVLLTDLLKTLTDEGCMISVGLHADDMAAATAHEFQGDASRSGEEVEGLGTVEVDIAAHDIEDILFGKIGRRTGLKRPRNFEMPAFIFSCDYSHILFSLFADHDESCSYGSFTFLLFYFLLLHLYI